MSRLLAFILIITTGVSLSAQSDELTETRLLNSFSKLTATNGINILLRKSSEEKAEIRISNGLLSDVITDVSNGQLRVKMRPQINKDISVLVVVFYKSLNEITVTKGASLETKTVILTDNFEFNVNMGSSIKAEIECKDVKVRAGSGATISLYGWSKRFEVKAQTKAQIFTETLNCDNAFIKVATGAEAWVKPKLYMEAIANSGGTIFYTSMPEKMAKKTATGGEVRNKVKKTGDDLIRDADL